jgi:hypothetical protein
MAKTSTPHSVLLSTENQKQTLSSFFSEEESQQWLDIRKILDANIKTPSKTSLRIIREHSIRTSHLSYQLCHKN